jgi:hypothetical protein
VNILNVHICTPSLKPSVLPEDVVVSIEVVESVFVVEEELLLQAANASVQTIIKEAVNFMIK